MRRAVLALALLSCACGGEEPERVAVPGLAGATKSSATVRAARRAYDGAPPVIPHAPIGADCVACHDARGMAVPELGFAPPSPHVDTPGIGPTSRCVQCHVQRASDELFVPSSFLGLAQDLRRAARATPGAPPVLPHGTFLRENCAACHAGPAAREEVRCTHPERVRCTQCHVPRLVEGRFERGAS